MIRARLPVALVLALTPACFADAPGFSLLTAAANMAEGTGSTTAEPPATSEPTTDAEDSGSGSATSSAGSTGDATSAAATSGDAGSTTADDAELLPPQILAVDMPAAVHLAGPVAVQVDAEHATAVRATLDGVELKPFQDQGGGVWLGTVPIFGAVDNGDHVVEVTATNGPLADTWPPVSFTVKTPAPGGQAWALLAPPASTTRRAAVTAEGDLLEVGAAEVEGVLKPSIRKRSAANGSELWPEGTIVLDQRQGSADAIAVRADGSMWVAMNVILPNKKQQARIVLLDADGHETGIEAPTEPGPAVRGIAATDDGGFFAAGFIVTSFGDADVVYWRMTGEQVATATAQTWDYLPLPDDDAHKFDDLAFDVVVTDGVAWVVGASAGKHEIDAARSHGLVLRLDVATGGALGSAIIADPVNAWRRSSFLGAGRHPDGVVVTGSESTDDAAMQRITVQVFNANGTRFSYLGEWPAPIAYGTGVAWSVHGVALVAGVVQDGDVLRGILYARGGLGQAFDHWFPGTEPSAANGLALDAYEQVYLVGERTLGGVRQARASRVHR